MLWLNEDIGQLRPAPYSYLLFTLALAYYLVLTFNQGYQLVSLQTEISSVLFVCLGNICRSPSADAVLKHKATKAGLAINVDSAGTAAYHIGAKPDARSQQAGENRGYNFSGLKSRKVTASDFADFDLIIPMDKNNYNDLVERCPEEHHHKIKLMMSFATSHLDQEEVPDPYYGGAAGFEYVLDLIEDASEGIILNINKNNKVN